MTIDVVDEVDDFTEHEITEEHNGFYYLGTGFVSRASHQQHYLLLDNVVGIRDFYRHTSAETIDFLMETSTTFTMSGRVEILKLEFTVEPNGTLLWTCLFKTFYLCVVQRRWKNILRQRKQMLSTPMVFKYLRGRERGEKVHLGLPTLRGMLSMLRKKPLKPVHIPPVCLAPQRQSRTSVPWSS